MEEQLVNIGIWGAIILFVIALAAAIILPIVNSLDNPASLVKSLGGIAIIGALFLFSYLVSGDEVTAKYITYKVTSPGASQLVGGGLTMMFLLLIITIVGVVFSEINKALKS